MRAYRSIFKPARRSGQALGKEGAHRLELRGVPWQQKQAPLEDKKLGKPLQRFPFARTEGGLRKSDGAFPARCRAKETCQQFVHTGGRNSNAGSLSVLGSALVCGFVWVNRTRQRQVVLKVL